MKSVKTTFVFILLSLCYLHSPAQNSSAQSNKPPINEPDYNKPKLFADLPDKIAFNPADVENLFMLKVGSSARVLPTNDLLFTGTIVSTSNPNDASVKTIVIKLINRPGATFTLSKISNANGTINYKGRIISRTNGDAFDVSKDSSGQYFLIKKNLYDLMNE